jgi:hypothetical protein
MRIIKAAPQRLTSKFSATSFVAAHVNTKNAKPQLKNNVTLCLNINRERCGSFSPHPTTALF